MNGAFWRGRKVLLTGHTGFKGSWMALWLQALGARVTGLALPPPTTPSLFEEARVGEGMRSLVGDIRDFEVVRSAVRETEPEVVIHMAAQSLVRRSYEAPQETYSTNVMGTLNVLEAIRSVPSVRAVVNVTTDKVYDNREWLWGYRESEPLGGHDPYSSSKACAELVTACYRASFFATTHGAPAVASARAGNVIGGGDWADDRLVPDLLRGFESCTPVRIRRPGAVRPWQHVLEPVRGYLMLAEMLATRGTDFAEAWNFGPADEDARPVEHIVRTLAGMWGPEAEWEIDRDEHPHEATYLKLDNSKARARLGWRPLLDLDGALTLVVDWARRRRAGESPRLITERQIADYERALKSRTV